MATINSKRLLKNLYAQGKIGWVENEGLFREGFTESFFAARDFVKEQLESFGITTRVDSLGNVFGFVEGESKDKIILCGSHLDSVKSGGIFDGAYGVIAAMEVAQTLKESGLTLKHSYEMVGFNSEEGSELGGSFGSRAFSGIIEKNPRDELLASYKLTAKDIENTKGDLKKYCAFLELHIEQGIVLHESGLTIGVPEAIAGITRYQCIVTGRSNHSGTTPMKQRKDALYETMRQMTKWLEFMREEKTMVCNIGYMNVSPGHICVVPMQTEFTVEIRAISQKDIDRAIKKLSDCLEEMETCNGKMTLLIQKPAADLDKNIGDIIYNCSIARGFSTLRMISGASHDASPISHVMPSAMIFVPSIDGISHAPDEATAEEDLIKGVQLLLDSILKLDETL